MREHCEAAVAADVREICLTNHAEVMGPDGAWRADFTEMRERFLTVSESIRDARRRFPDLGIRLGIELEYRPYASSCVRPSKNRSRSGPPEMLHPSTM